MLDNFGKGSNCGVVHLTECKDAFSVYITSNTSPLHPAVVLFFYFMETVGMSFTKSTNNRKGFTFDRALTFMSFFIIHFEAEKLETYIAHT